MKIRGPCKHMVCHIWCADMQPLRHLTSKVKIHSPKRQICSCPSQEILLLCSNTRPWRGVVPAASAATCHSCLSDGCRWLSEALEQVGSGTWRPPEPAWSSWSTASLRVTHYPGPCSSQPPATAGDHALPPHSLSSWAFASLHSRGKQTSPSI